MLLPSNYSQFSAHYKNRLVAIYFWLFHIHHEKKNASHQRIDWKGWRLFVVWKPAKRIAEIKTHSCVHVMWIHSCIHVIWITHRWQVLLGSVFLHNRAWSTTDWLPGAFNLVQVVQQHFCVLPADVYQTMDQKCFHNMVTGTCRCNHMLTMNNARLGVYTVFVQHDIPASACREIQDNDNSLEELGRDHQSKSLAASLGSTSLQHGNTGLFLCLQTQDLLNSCYGCDSHNYNHPSQLHSKFKNRFFACSLKLCTKGFLTFSRCMWALKGWKKLLRVCTAVNNCDNCSMSQICGLLGNRCSGPSAYGSCLSQFVHRCHIKM